MFDSGTGLCLSGGGESVVDLTVDSPKPAVRELLIEEQHSNNCYINK